MNTDSNEQQGEHFDLLNEFRRIVAGDCIERDIARHQRVVTAIEQALRSRASVAAVEGDDLVSRAEVLKLVDACTCGSGPEWRSVGMRHHALNCQTYLATLIRAIPAAASSPAPAPTCDDCDAPLKDGKCEACAIRFALPAQPEG